MNEESRAFNVALRNEEVTISRGWNADGSGMLYAYLGHRDPREWTVVRKDVLERYQAADEGAEHKEEFV